MVFILWLSIVQPLNQCFHFLETELVYHDHLSLSALLQYLILDKCMLAHIWKNFLYRISQYLNSYLFGSECV